MHKLLSWLKPSLPGVLALGVLLGLAAILELVEQNQPRIPPCEAMRPYLLYQGTYYYEAMGSNLPASDRGTLVTTTGDGPAQAHSCLADGGAVYRVKGRPITTALALDTGDGLRVFEVSSPAPTPTATLLTQGITPLQNAFWASAALPTPSHRGP